MIRSGRLLVDFIMKKRIFATILTLIMTVTLMPVAAFASTGSHTHDNTWTGTASLPSSPGNYYLTADVVLTDEWSAPAGETGLCLNGHIIKQTGTNKRVINVPSGATLNIYDCGTTEHYFSVDGSTKIWSLLDAKTGGCKTIFGGCITGGNSANIAQRYGGGIWIDGNLNMYGGNIVGNWLTTGNDNGEVKGGGVYVQSGSFTMNGGSITGNVVKQGGSDNHPYGGGLYVFNGVFTMNGGSIAENSGGYGGGISAHKTMTVNKSLIAENQKVEIKGGTIEKNVSVFSGGGMFICSDVGFIMSGGTVQNNLSHYIGGGICIADDKTGNATITGNAKIINNIAVHGTNVGNGGGISMYGSNVTISGNVEISGNKADDNGGGVALWEHSASAITLGGSVKITGNNDTCTITNDVVTGNGKTGNLYVGNNSSVTIGSGGNAVKEGMTVGVTWQNIIGKFTDYSAAESSVKYFFSDNPDYFVAYNVGKYLEIKAPDIDDYKIDVISPENGTITSGSRFAKQGDTITLSVAPANGFKLISDSLKVYKAGDVSTTFPVTAGQNGTYTFTMPDTAVTVTAEFEAVAPGIEPTGIDYSDGHLHFNDPSVEPVRMYARAADPVNYEPVGGTIADTYLDLGTETIVTDFAYNCYSLTGGKKWKYCSGGVKSKDIAKWFSSDCTILIADNYNKKLKRPDEGATVYYLGKTSRRPKLPVTRINYSHYRDDFAFTNGQWCLVDANGADIEFSEYEFMIQDSVGCTMAVDHTSSEQGTEITDYKAITEAGRYGRWPGEGGVFVPDLSSKGAKQKAKILVRLTAEYDEESDIYSPASKSRKFTITSVNKAPSVKIDYTKERIKLKTGMNMYFGSEIPTDSSGVPIAYPMPADSEVTDISDLEGTILINCSAQAAGTGINLSKYITETRNGLLVWQPATDRKPASAVRALQTAARRSIDSRISVKVSATGRVDLAADYEALCNDKWIRALRISGDTTNILPVRIKGTAKSGNDGEGKYAAGYPGTLVLYYGTLANGKSGCTGAVIYPSGTTDEEIKAAIDEWYGTGG